MIKPQYVPIIRREAEHIREKYGFSTDAVIGNYIFTILQNDCVLMCTPKPNEPDLDGFSTEKVIDGKRKTVVFINSAKNVEKQNFCAAHELGHQCRIERLIKDEFPEEIITPSDVEEIMNRFAAELMMPEKDFRRRCGTAFLPRYGEDINSKYRISIVNAVCMIIEIMNHYYVPYKAVVYRLGEVGIFSNADCKKMLYYEDTKKDLVNGMIPKMGITRLRTPNNARQVSEPISSVAECLKDPEITKYLPKKKFEEYLSNIGVPQKEIGTLKERRKMETEILDVAKPS